MGSLFYFIIVKLVFLLELLFLKKINIIFYVSLILFTFLYGLIFLEIHQDDLPIRLPALSIGYFCFYILLPLIIISFLYLLISYFKKFKFQALKEISLHIYSIGISICILYFLNDYLIRLNNKMEVSISNYTEDIFYPVRIEGRNALNELDTLMPNETRKIIFRGKDIDYKTKNDYNNEVAIHYYSKKNKWVHYKLLGQYFVIQGDWHIKIFAKDSIIVETIIPDNY